MATKYLTSTQNTSESRDDIHLSCFKGCCDDSATEFCQIVFVRSPNFLYQAMRSQAFEHSRYLVCGFTGEVFSEFFVAKAANVELAAQDSSEQIKIIAAKKVEASIAASLFPDGFTDFFNVFARIAGFVNSGNKIDIASVRRCQQIPQGSHRVNILSQCSLFHGRSSIAVFDLSVVFEKSNIINSSFNSKNQIVLIVHFDADRSHAVLYSCAHNTCAEVIANFSLIITSEFFSKERSDVVSFNRMDGSSYEFFINISQVALLFEDDVRGVFGLHYTPVVIVFELPDDRTILIGGFIQNAMNLFNVNVVGEFLVLVKVSDFGKSIIKHCIIGGFPVEFVCQLIVAVEIKLQTKRSPGRHTQITQSQCRVNEIEVIMQALGVVVSEICFMRFFVVPRFISGAGLHHRENMYQSGMAASLVDNLLDSLFFSEILLLADKINFQTIVFGDLFSILTNRLPQRHCPFGIVENANIMAAEITSHAVSITNAWDCACQNDTIKTGSDAFDSARMSFNEILHGQCSQYANNKSALSEKQWAA